MYIIHQNHCQLYLGQGEITSVGETEVADPEYDEVVVVEVGRRASLSS